MKKILFLLFLPLTFLSARSQTADAVVKRYLTFTGGAAGWQKVKSLTDSGTYNYGGMEFPFRSYALRPNLYRYIVPFNGKYFEQAFDGKNGWKIDAFNGETKKTPLTGKAALAMMNEADVELEPPFVGYRSKGHAIALQGTDTVNGVLCNKIRLVKKGGEQEIYSFSKADGSLFKKTALSKNAELKNSFLDTYYSDYRAVGPVMIPFTAISKSNGDMILTITVKTAEVNVPVSRQYFAF